MIIESEKKIHFFENVEEEKEEEEKEEKEEERKDHGLPQSRSHRWNYSLKRLRKLIILFR